MAFIIIADGTMINTENVESVERKGKLTTSIMMTSGDKHLAEFPFEVMVKRIAEGDNSLKEILRNIDNNTMKVRL